MGQAVSSFSVIGKSIKIGNLIVAQNDFPNGMNWNDAKENCKKLGVGWRLPTQNELNTMCENRDKIGWVQRGGDWGIYWSSSNYDANYAWLQKFGSCTQDAIEKKFLAYARAVRTQ